MAKIIFIARDRGHIKGEKFELRFSSLNEAVKFYNEMKSTVAHGSLWNRKHLLNQF